jgi:hypothetical protein
MMKKMIILPLFMSVMNILAQTEKPDSLKNHSFFKKNEVSVNTAPVFKQLLTTGGSGSTRFSIGYKRYLNEKSALRFSLMADRIDNAVYNIHERSVIILNSDSVLIRQETVSPPYFSPHINIGYERLFGKRKLKWFYGADLVLGYSQNKTFKQNIVLYRDSTQGSTSWTEKEYRPEIVARSTTKTFFMGVTPFFGVKYPLSKRFSVSAQVGVDAIFRDQRVTDVSQGKNVHSHFSTFDFNQDTGFLNDISIIYKF